MRGASQAFWLIYGLFQHNGPVIIVAAAVTMTTGTSTAQASDQLGLVTVQG